MATEIKRLSDGKMYARRDGGDVLPLTNDEFVSLYEAKKTNSLDAAWEAFTDKMGNARSVVSDFDPKANDGRMAALEYTHPLATTLGGLAPYVPAAFAGPMGIAAVAGLGAAEGYLFGNPGEKKSDALWGGGMAAGGNMVGRVLQNIPAVSKYLTGLSETKSDGMMETMGDLGSIDRLPAVERMQSVSGADRAGIKLTSAQRRTGKPGFWDDAFAGSAAAKRFGAQNQDTLNKAAIEALGLDPAKYTKITDDVLDTALENAKAMDEINPTGQLERISNMQKKLSGVRDSKGNVNPTKLAEADAFRASSTPEEFKALRTAEALNDQRLAPLRSTEGSSAAENFYQLGKGVASSGYYAAQKLPQGLLSNYLGGAGAMGKPAYDAELKSSITDYLNQ